MLTPKPAVAVRRLTFAICTFDRADRLPRLLAEMRAQASPVPFEVLVVDNNSSDATPSVVAEIAAMPGIPVRYVREREQGIPFARNRALADALDSDALVFIDDDELPYPGLLESAVRALTEQGARCAGGRVEIVFPGTRPRWLADDLLGFLAEVNHGEKPFWIKDPSTPIWTANIAYDMRLFRDSPELRFDARYNRRGHGVGGGSDAMLFRELLRREVPILYCPQMRVQHHVEPWRMRRSYFLKLHFVAGRKYGQFQTGDYRRTVFGVPPFMVVAAARHWFRTAAMFIRRQPGVLRQAMNGTHALGMVWGRMLRARESRPNAS